MQSLRTINQIQKREQEDHRHYRRKSNLEAEHILRGYTIFARVYLPLRPGRSDKAAESRTDQHVGRVQAGHPPESLEREEKRGVAGTTQGLLGFSTNAMNCGTRNFMVNPLILYS